MCSDLKTHYKGAVTKTAWWDHKNQSMNRTEFIYKPMNP